MRTAIFLLATMTVVALSEAVVCPRDYCKHVQCTVTEETCHQGKVVPNSSFCRCCPTCVKYLKPGDYCNSILHRIIGPGNNFEAYRCPPHYICARNRCSPLL